MSARFEELVGKYIDAVFWSDDFLTFKVAQSGQEHFLTYEVEGDCCSSSYFHDLIGFDKLLLGPVVKVEDVELDENDRADLKANAEFRDGELKVYGYRIVTEHPQFGEVSTVVSFRNSSNGYYGGYMELVTGGVRKGQRRLDGDVLP